jgi:predicted alpha/beta superfamily hydrolase
MLNFKFNHKLQAVIRSDILQMPLRNAKPCSLAAIKMKIKKIMKHSRIQNFLLTVLLFISSSSLFGQKSEPKKRLLEPDATISSKIMGKDYQLYISFPRGYSNKDTTKYPVLYMLDGRFLFPIAKSARENMDLGHELEKVIIVGIGSGLDSDSWFINRTFDYTPSQDTSNDRQTEKEFGFPKGDIHSGGGANFYRCITTEIIPYVDKYYKTTNDRGIYGHSLGGLFAAYCLLNSKGIFNRYGINSPSLWWNNSALLNQADSLFSRNKTWNIPPTKIFISVGEKEGYPMIPEMVKLSTLLEDKAYKNVSLTWHIFEGETHLSVSPANISRTLSVLYKTR